MYHTYHRTSNKAFLSLLPRGRSLRHIMLAGSMLALLFAATVLIPLATANAAPFRSAGAVGPNQAISSDGSQPLPSQFFFRNPPPAIQEIAQSTTFQGGYVLATASCPAGEYALGGGWSVFPNLDRVTAATLNGNTWEVSVMTTSSVSQTIYAYVECLYNVRSAVVIQRTVSTTVGSGQFGTMSAFCNSGEVPVGFGFNLNESATLELQAANAETFESAVWWNFWVTNHDGVTHTIYGTVSCLSNVTRFQYPWGGAILTVYLYPQYVGNAGGNVYVGQTGTVQVSCPSGYATAGGGLDYRDANTQNVGSGNLYLLHAASDGWQGGIYAISTNGSIPLVPTAWAVCLGFSY